MSSPFARKAFGWLHQRSRCTRSPSASSDDSRAASAALTVATEGVGNLLKDVV